MSMSYRSRGPCICCFFQFYLNFLKCFVCCFFKRCLVFWENWIISTASWLQNCLWRVPHLLPDRLLHSRVWRFICRCFGKNDPGDQSRNGSKKGGRGPEGRDSVIPGGLSHNICMPSTGEEAMKRLLACKGKDPYR